MARRTRFHGLFLTLAGFSLLAVGCSTTSQTHSQTNVSMPSQGWLASLKTRLSGRPSYSTKVDIIEDADRKPGAKLYIAYGKVEEARGNLPKAEEAFNKALTIEPQSVDAMLGIARVNQLAGRDTAAEQGFLKAEKLNPQSPEVAVAVGQYYADLGRWDEAIARHHKAIQLAPMEKNYRYGMARVLTKAGQIDEALTNFEQTVGIAAAHYNIGVILQEQGQLEQSEQHLLKATIHGPEMKQAHEWLDVVRREQARKRTIASRTAAAAIQQVTGQQSPQPAATPQVHSAGHGNAPAQYQQRTNQAPLKVIQGKQSTQNR